MQKPKTKYLPVLFLLLFITTYAQKNATSKSQDLTSGLNFRSIGPALTSGRIADIAIHPKNENVRYVAVGSGGVWKTTNSGTTWKPIFDDQTSYSIGCITIDPNNSHTIWVGTGENVGGRHVGFGDGIYVSYDDGETWKNMGLKHSEHISKIIIHPEDSNIIWVAAQGPLWSKGGQRGLYKTIDGGKTWKKTLGDNEWTGATDIVIDPTNPNLLYAATWQRHRTVAAYMGGGPGSGIYKSTDGGDTWVKLTKGIPESNLGKIGLAISPFNSEIIYAAIELDRRKGGLFMSVNKGNSWTKQSNAISGGTGPHYYQELYASPHHDGKLFLMSNTVQISDNHGKTFYNMNEKAKHVDSHALAFKKSDPNYLLFGTDGGLYESFDLTKSWKYIRNLPVTQYYKVAVDDSYPFYKIYGGTQDNGSHGGPSRTTKKEGIVNSDWWITLTADGHQSATEPGNPDITYGEFQEGELWRIDQTTGETVYIQPQAKEGEPFERFNWDAPILISPHNPKRLYFASQRVWRSDNRGDSWSTVSKDLTRNQVRLAQPIMGQQQSWDNAWDVLAMSNYNTITSLAESPKQEGLLYAGTDDGIIQITENGGETWRKIEVGSIKGIPATAFVNDLRADLFDANIVYAVLDNHKYGDFKPYVIKSIDKGKTWSSMQGNLPDRLITWRLVQDHINRNLFFIATEYGVYFTIDNGKKWIKLTQGIPTIAIRDITIQRRESDLVAASFGRGFFIFDDIEAIRHFNTAMSSSESILFNIKPAYWYIEKGEIHAQGNDKYKAPNPPFGAVFTYYLPEKIKSLKEQRKDSEKEVIKTNKSIPFPGWNALNTEELQQSPSIILTIRDANNNVINTLKGSNKKGFNRISWNLEVADKSGEALKPPKPTEQYFNFSIMATPGDYTVALSKLVDGELTDLTQPKSFKVIPLRKGALEGASYEDIIAFREAFQQFQQDLKSTNVVLSKALLKVEAMKRALAKAKKPSNALSKELHNQREALLKLHQSLKGSKAKHEIGEKNDPAPNNVNFMAKAALGSSTYGPTQLHKATLNTANKRLIKIKSDLKKMVDSKIPDLENKLKAVGAPWTEGMGLD
ncbi:glycosyl hydrolase [Tamlana sp. 2201CG12-4]|uniref:WD40/YVTN/BNR-like repeat-containing protein n=1 Tax=Tamlana sp. 2201CG12-4 TaxID=3112582 RepID=UPI002DB96361|nr:glycosyl hydrolase [Tamlana sp. 2201CG12-4]MEC3905474.1 glycosyl hydrolase [Tamlana sp. 2201CG12-4]